MMLAAKVSLMVLAIFVQWGKVTENLLDLTTKEVRQLDEARTSVCGSRGGGVYTSGGPVPDPEVPLALELDSLDRGTYKTGDEIVAVLRLRNIGTEPLMIPWSPDSEQVFGKKCEWPPKSTGARALKGSISLVFMDEVGNTQFIASHGLYAVMNRAGTYHTLAPGQSAVVKIWGSIGFYNIIEKRRAKGLEFKLPQEFVVSGSFNLDDSALFFPYKRILSKSSIRAKVVEK